jgi:hypothetical protein
MIFTSREQPTRVKSVVTNAIVMTIGKLKNNYGVGHKVCVTDPRLPKRSYGDLIWICIADVDPQYSYRREVGEYHDILCVTRLLKR